MNIIIIHIYFIYVSIFLKLIGVNRSAQPFCLGKRCLVLPPRLRQMTKTIFEFLLAKTAERGADAPNPETSITIHENK